MIRINRFNQLVERSQTVEGRWQINKKHEVVYKTQSTKKTEEVRLKASLIAVEAGALVLGVTQRQKEGVLATSLLRLSGVWKADPKNKLTFEAAGRSGSRDILTFTGQWEIGANHELVYSWEAARLKTKTTVLREVVVKGHWDITEKNRLTYYVGGDTRHALRFRGTFQSRSLLAKDGEIRFQLGAEGRKTRTARTVSLFGRWKFSKKTELFFEMEYSDARRRQIAFGGTLLLTRESQIEVMLTARDGEPLGTEVIFTRDFFGKDARFFLRLKKNLSESAAEAGVALTW